MPERTGPATAQSHIRVDPLTVDPEFDRLTTPLLGDLSPRPGRPHLERRQEEIASCRIANRGIGAVRDRGRGQETDQRRAFIVISESAQQRGEKLAITTLVVEPIRLGAAPQRRQLIVCIGG